MVFSIQIGFRIPITETDYALPFIQLTPLTTV
jgi:hypothetical protein